MKRLIACQVQHPQATITNRQTSAAMTPVNAVAAKNRMLVTAALDSLNGAPFACVITIR